MSWFWSSSRKKQPEDDDDDDEYDDDEEYYEEEEEDDDDDDDEDQGAVFDSTGGTNKATLATATATNGASIAEDRDEKVTTKIEKIDKHDGQSPLESNNQDEQQTDDTRSSSIIIGGPEAERIMERVQSSTIPTDDYDDNDSFHASSGGLVHEIENEAQRSALVDTDDEISDDDEDDDDNDDQDDHEVDSDVEKRVWAGQLPDAVTTTTNNSNHKMNSSRVRADSALTFAEEDGEQDNMMGEEEDDDEGDDEEDNGKHHGHNSNSMMVHYDTKKVSLGKEKSDPSMAASKTPAKDSDEGDDDDDEATSTQEKQSLLVLAAEHDRVDILQAILTDDTPDRVVLLQGGWKTTSSGITEPMQPSDNVGSSIEGKEGEAHSATAMTTTMTSSTSSTPLPTSMVILTIPPLHIAVSYGSTNATNCLLRMGADPSIRPDWVILQHQMAENKRHHRMDHPVSIPNMNRFDGLSAWELVFGMEGDGVVVGTPKKRTSWSLFGGGNSNVADDESMNKVTGETQKSSTPVSPKAVASSASYSGQRRSSTGSSSSSAWRPDVAPSKREGIRHAFTAEALRCIGADEVDRLRQLLHSGMPASIDIGGRRLYDWAVEMSAMACEELLRPNEAARHDEMDDNRENAITSHQDSSLMMSNTTPSPSKRTAVLDRPPCGVGEEGTTADVKAEYLYMLNHLDELESLSKALSMCLDNLAEEVAVCSGLLLMGSGAAALASHVRSLKLSKETKLEELARMEEAGENSEDELAYWARELGEEGQRIAEQVIIVTQPSRNSKNTLSPDMQDSQQMQQQKQLLKAQIAASEHKVRKLRASIEDLSDENARDLHEVERRGLSGGIRLVRGLREEIREIDFQLSEIKSADAVCRTKISLIQAKIRSNAKHAGEVKEITAPSSSQEATETNGSSHIHVSTNESIPKSGTTSSTSIESSQNRSTTLENLANSMGGESTTTDKWKASELIESGQSTALVVRDTRNRGLLNLWQILMRIIGLQDGRTTADGVRLQPAIII